MTAIETGHVTIGPRFFQTAIKDYHSPAWAYVREIMQNSIDAGAENVTWFFLPEDDGLTLIIEDDGCGMTRDVLTSKLLCLGGSGKEFQGGAVGGFGKAKELLFFSQQSYRIETLDLLVTGEGASYTIEEVDLIYPGTRITVKLQRNYLFNDTTMADALRNFCLFAQTPVNVTLTYPGTGYEPQVWKPNLRKGSPRRKLQSGQIYSNRSFNNRFICRINGTPMFSSYTQFDGTVILELDGDSEHTLAANRDSLKEPYASELQAFLTEIAIDKRSALRNREARYKKFHGDRPEHRASSSDKSAELVRSAALSHLNAVIETQVGQVGAGSGAAQLGSVLSLELGDAAVFLGTEFIIKNTTGLETPGYYQPDDPSFGHYQQTLAKWWTRCLLQLHELFDHSASFGVGFILSEDVAAEYEPQGPYGQVYYLNPAEVVTQARSSSRSFKKRWALTDRHGVLAIAVHEFIHGLGYTRHDEDFSSKMTEVMAIVMANLKKFNSCFS